MAVSERELAITLRAIIGDFVNPMRTAKAELVSFGQSATETFDKVEESAEKLKNVWKSMFEAFIGVEVIEGLKKIAESANAASDALEIAAQTTKNFGHDFNIEDMDGWLRKLAASAQGGGYALRDMRATVQELATTGATEEQQQRLTIDAIGLSAAKHISLAEATHIAVEAATGHVAMLGRYGIQVKDAEGKLLSFSDVMKNWEQLVAGDAQKRAEGLEGAFGRVTNSLDRLKNAFGGALIPLFTGAANAISHLVDAIALIPGPILAAVAAILFTTLSLTALGLMLPAVKLAFEFLTTGVGVARAGIELFGKVIRGVFIVMETIIPVIRGIAAAFVGLGAAEDLAAAPPLAIAGALIVLGVALYELVSHFDDVQKAMSNFVTFGRTALDEFRSGFLDNVKSIGYGALALADVFNHDYAGAAANLKIGQSLSRDMPFTAHVITTAIKDGVDSGIEHAKAAWKSLTDFFGSALGSIKMPVTSWAGLGGPTKLKPEDLSGLFGAIDAAIAEAKHRVEMAQNALQETQARLTTLRAERDPKQALSQESAAKEQALEREELEKTLVLRKAIANERDVELRAAQVESAASEHVDRQSKAHAELAKRMNEHVTAASRLNGEYIKMGGTIAQIGRAIRDAFDPFKTQSISLESIKSSGDFEDKREKLTRAQEADRSKFSNLHAVDPASATDQADENARQAEFSRRLASLNVKIAESELVFAEWRAALQDPVTAAQSLANAHKAVNAALMAADRAQHDETVTVIKSKAAHEAANDALGTFAKGLIDKLNIPGLSVKQRTDENGNATGGISLGFSWMSFLLAAVEKTKAFADIMKIVGELMNVFAQIIDALRPVIDLLLKAVAAVANIFIDLWNVIARVLRIFGIHVAMLEKINTDFNNLSNSTAPLISIVHDIPTMNELASGKIGALSPNPVAAAHLFNPITDTLKSPDLGGGILGGLGTIAGILLAIKVAGGFFGGSGGIGGVLGHLFGGGGGGLGGAVTGGLSKLGLNFGSGTNGTALLGSLGAIAAGAGVGAGIGDLFGGGSHTTNGAIGGAAGVLGAGFLAGMGGGVPALLAAGPAGWAALAAGALIGGLAGGAFGHSAPNAHDNPDSQVDGYGQSVADLQGAGVGGNAVMIANGKSYTEAGGIQTALGGQSEMGFIAQYIAQAGGKGLTAQEMAEFKNMPGQGGITGGKDGWFDLANGTHARWDQLVADAQDAIQKIGVQFQSTMGSVSNIAGSLSSQAASISRASASATNELMGAVSSAIAATSSPVNVTMTQHVTHTGDITGYRDIQGIADDLSEMTDRATRSRPYLFNRVAVR